MFTITPNRFRPGMKVRIADNTTNTEHWWVHILEVYPNIYHGDTPAKTQILILVQLISPTGKKPFDPDWFVHDTNSTASYQMHHDSLHLL